MAFSLGPDATRSKIAEGPEGTGIGKRLGSSGTAIPDHRPSRPALQNA